MSNYCINFLCFFFFKHWTKAVLLFISSCKVFFVSLTSNNVYLEIRERDLNMSAFLLIFRSSSDATKLYELAKSLNEKAVTKVRSLPIKCH